MIKSKKICYMFFKLTGFLILIFLSFNIILYTYCYITPKISIHKTQSYYLYDNQKKLDFNLFIFLMCAIIYQGGFYGKIN